jgi:hypothetical protein
MAQVIGREALELPSRQTEEEAVQRSSVYLHSGATDQREGCTGWSEMRGCNDSHAL